MHLIDVGLGGWKSINNLDEDRSTLAGHQG